MGLSPGTVAPDPTVHRGRPLTVVVILLAVLLAGCGDLVELRPLRPVSIPQPRQPTVVVDADGGRLAELVGDGQGHPISLDEVAPVLLDAVIAVEDVRFRSHGGVDVRALGRALVRNVRDGRIVEGGSTITQQLAKNTATGTARTLERKVTEASIARQLEHQLSKDEILARYLNTAYFGSGRPRDRVRRPRVLRRPRARARAAAGGAAGRHAALPRTLRPAPPSGGGPRPSGPRAPPHARPGPHQRRRHTRRDGSAGRGGCTTPTVLEDGPLRRSRPRRAAAPP